MTLSNEKSVIIHFINESSDIAESKDYNTHRTVFVVSKYLRNEVEKQLQAASEQESEQPQIELECPLLAFDITTELFEKNCLDVEVRAGVQEFVRILDIDEKETVLYESLAKATVYDRCFREEIKRCACAPSMQLFAFYFLGEYTTTYSVHARASGHRVCE